MDRRDFFFRQRVKQEELDQVFDDAEAADQAIVVDTDYFGVLIGLDVSEHSPNNLTVDVTGGTARTRTGQRVYVPASQQVNCAVDFQNVNTAVGGVGNSRIISVFIKFTRNNQFPRTDGNGITVFYDRLESFRFFVKQGAEALSPTPPSLELDGVLLCDITLTHGQTTITNGDISIARREDLYILSTTDKTIRAKRNRDALQSLLQLMQNHKDGTEFAHDASSIMVDPTGAMWADFQEFGGAPTTIDLAFKTLIVSALSNQGLPYSGAHKIGVAESTYQQGAGLPVLSAGMLWTRIEDLRNAANLYTTGVTFGVGDTVSAGAIPSVFTGIVNKLKATSTSTDNGAYRIGLSISGFISAWSGVSNVYSAFLRLSSIGATDGAAHVAAKASGALPAGTVRSQLDDLDSRATTNANGLAGKANKSGDTFTGAVVFDGGATIPSGDTLTVASGATVTSASGSTANLNGTTSIGGAATVASGGSIIVASGATATAASGSTTNLNGTTSIGGAATVASGGSVTVASGGTFTANSGSITDLAGRRRLNRARVTLTDTSQTVNVGQGDRFLLPATPGAPRTITLASTGTIPAERETLTFIWHPGSSGGPLALAYTFRREDNTTIATFVYGPSYTGTAFAEFEFTGGVWRLSLSSGSRSEGTDNYGVLPGAGA